MIRSRKNPRGRVWWFYGASTLNTVVERPSRVGTRHCRVATRQTHGLALGSPWVRQRRATVVQRCSNGEGFREGFYAVASFAHAVAMPGAGVQHL